MDEPRQISGATGRAPENLQSRSQPNSQRPISAAEAAAFVSSCFTLVRPVGMNEAHAKEWIAQAAKELAGFPFGRVESAAGKARTACTHHGQIVPTMIKHMEGMYEWETPAELHSRRNAALAKPRQDRIEMAPEVRGLIDGTAKSLRTP